MAPHQINRLTASMGRSLLRMLFWSIALMQCAAFPAMAAPSDGARLRILVRQDADIRGEGANSVMQLARDLPDELVNVLKSKGYAVVTSTEKPYDVEVKLLVDVELSYRFVNAWVVFKKAVIKIEQNEQIIAQAEYQSAARGGRFKTYGKEGAEYAKAAAEALAARIMETPSFASAARNSPVQAPVTITGRDQTTVPVFVPGSSDVDQLPQVRGKKKKDAYAIVIGIEEYRQKLPRADFAANDAQTMANYLMHVLGYPEENVITLINDRALKSDMEKYFEQWLTNNVEPQSSVFIYYSGHGAPDPRTGSAYLVPYDGDPTFIKQTGYSLKRMYEVLNKLQNRETIVALDSCFSGAGGRSVLAKGSRPLVMNLKTTTPLAKNVVVLSASSGDQISSSYDDKGHGLFTYFLLKGMKEEDVIGQNGNLNVKELFSYLKPQVSRISRKIYNNEQTPQLFQGNGKSEE